MSADRNEQEHLQERDYDDLFGPLHDAMFDGWRWEQLTSGERAAFRKTVRPVLDALLVTYEIRRRSGDTDGE